MTQLAKRIRYVEAVSCPKCGKRGALNAIYIMNVRERWKGPYFRVEHRIWSHDRAKYRIACAIERLSTRDALHVSRVFERSECYFGKDYPGKITAPIRGPNDIPRPHPPRKDRQRILGPYVPRGRLSHEQIQRIKKEYTAGGVTQQNIATRFAVSRRLIGMIIAGQLYRNSTDGTSRQ